MIMFVQLQFDHYFTNIICSPVPAPTSCPPSYLTAESEPFSSDRGFKYGSAYLHMYWNQMETDMDYIGVIGNFKGNVIFCRFLSWFLLFEYLFERSDFKGSRAD